MDRAAEIVRDLANSPSTYIDGDDVLCVMCRAETPLLQFVKHSVADHHEHCPCRRAQEWVAEQGQE